MEENTVRLEEKLKELVSLGRKKKSILEISEINDFFTDMELDAEQMDKVFEHLEANNIDVLRISGDGDDIDVDDADIVLTDEDDVDMEKLDLSVPDGISIEDPVRMYLKEIGKVPLLTVTRTRRSVLQRRTCALSSALQSAMWAGACSSLTLYRKGIWA